MKPGKSPLTFIIFIFCLKVNRQAKSIENTKFIAGELSLIISLVLYLDGFSFHLSAPYSEERLEAAWEYAREHDTADRLK